MDHDQAVKEMATERYLLDELPAELRDAFEEHLFECPECTLDLRVAMAFIDEAKVQLPGLTANEVPAKAEVRVPEARVVGFTPRDERSKDSWWASWWRPAFAGPVFAALLAVVGYQNLVTYPALRTQVASAEQPKLLPWTALHAGTRGGTATEVTGDLKNGAVLPIELPAGDSQSVYASYAFEMYDAQGKVVWTETYSTAGQDGVTLSLVIPGAAIHPGSYSLTIFGVGPQGSRTELERHAIDFRSNSTP